MFASSSPRKAPSPFFGGDGDNFEYPRFNLDVSFFRVYENGQPVKSDHFFKWSATGPKEEDLVFVVGHPGTTNRLETLAKLVHRRDSTLPYALNRLRTMEAALEHYAARGPEQRRQAATDIHRVANARKAMSGQYQGLLDPKILEAKRQQEDSLTVKLGRAGETAITPEDTRIKPWLTICQSAGESGEVRGGTLTDRTPRCLRQRSLQHRPPSRAALGRASQTFGRAAPRIRQLGPRLAQVPTLLTGSALPRTRTGEASPRRCRSWLNHSAASIRWRLRSSTARRPRPARRNSSKARNSSTRPSGRSSSMAAAMAIAASQDSLIVLARLIDPDSLNLRKQFEAEVEEPERQAFAEIAKHRFAAFGRSVAPDATFTLRLAYGTVKGYEVEGETLPLATTFGGAFAKADAFNNTEPNALPKLWRDRQSTLDMTTPFNFASTADTIGGNSGSPVLNRAGELVGVNFDRNRHGLVRNFVYTDVQARHIAVHCRAVLEALSKIYDAPELVKELNSR